MNVIAYDPYINAEVARDLHVTLVDLDELFTPSDRLIVLYDGRIVGEFKPDETDIYEVGHLMTGHEVQHAEKG